MSGPWQATPNQDADVRPCGSCEKDVLVGDHPSCPHGHIACPECGHEAVCVACRKAAFVEMCKSGEYDPKADPFFDHTAEAADAAYWDRSGSTYDPVTNTHRRIR
jgi:hypothetical protein